MPERLFFSGIFIFGKISNSNVKNSKNVNNSDLLNNKKMVVNTIFSTDNI